MTGMELKEYPTSEHMKNVSAPCLVRFGQLKFKLVSRDGHVSSTTEPWLMFPVLMQSTTARSLAEGNARGWPVFPTPGRWAEINKFADVWVDVVNNDQAPNNILEERHESNVFATYPPQAMRIRKRCNTHALHLVFKRAWAKTQFVCRNFSFFKLLANAKHAQMLDFELDAIVSEVVILPKIKPPADAIVKNMRTLNMLIDTTASFMTARRQRKRQHGMRKFLRDLNDLPKYFNSHWDGPLIHYCYAEVIITPP